MSRLPATRRPKEIELHIPVVSFLKRAWPVHLLWWHTPNGELRDHKTRIRKSDGKKIRYSPTGQKLKAMGAKAGVPELTFVMPNGQAAFLELKRRGEGLSDDQIEFRDLALACGCAYAVADSFDEVERILARWLAKFGLKLRATGGVRAPAGPLFDGAQQ